MQRPRGGLFERQLSMTREKRRLDPVVDGEDKVILPVIKVVHLLSSSHLSGTPAVLQSGRLLSTEPNRVDEPFKVEEAETVKVPPPLPEKLLVLDGNGFVGSHVCREALERVQNCNHTILNVANNVNRVDEPFKVEEAETVKVPPPLPEKLLVLGGNGFVGSHVCREALERGMCVSSLSSSFLRDLKR